MKSKSIINDIRTMMIVLLFLGGCAFSRNEVTPQSARGPQGGQMFCIDQSGSEYVEFVAKPIAGKEWLLQIYGYDKNMKPKMHYSSAKVEIITPDARKIFVTLWETKPYVWNHGAEWLENKAQIEGHIFKAHVMLKQGGRSTGTHVDFNYPFETIETTPA